MDVVLDTLLGLQVRTHWAVSAFHPPKVSQVPGTPVALVVKSKLSRSGSAALRQLNPIRVNSRPKLRPAFFMLKQFARYLLVNFCYLAETSGGGGPSSPAIFAL